MIDNLEKGNLYSFSLKDVNGNPVDIKSSGTGDWNFSLPPDAAASAHTVSWDQWKIKDSYLCPNIDVQWQWINFSTRFNQNKNSQQSLNTLKKDGSYLSAWEMLVSNPENDILFDANPRWPRKWFKSLIAKQPQKSDVYQTTTFLQNYDETTGSWFPSDVTWRNGECSSAKSVSLPYIKSLLAGKQESEYASETRKHLDIEWIETTKIEVAVVVDRSGSMALFNKMKQAKLAAKFAAGGFVSEKNGMSPNVRVAVYSFGDDVQTVFSPTWNPNLSEIYEKIDEISAGGRTALFDALSQAIRSFSPDNSNLKLLYVISDGLDNESLLTKDQIISLFKSENIAIHTFAYGKDADVDLLLQMAKETNGTFSEQEEHLFLKPDNAVVTVLANSYGMEQVGSGKVSPHSLSQSIFIDSLSDKIRIFGHLSEIVDNPISVRSIDNETMTQKTTVFPINDANFFITEISVPSNAKSRYIQVQNLSNVDISYRVVIAQSKQLHAMDVQTEPMGNFIWPTNAKVFASIKNKNGLLTGLSVTGVLVNPQGDSILFPLNDEGVNGDASAEDGVYTAFFPELKGNGTYEWEVVASNLGLGARTTRIGTSLPAEAPFDSKFDSTNFSLVRNGQFVVDGCCEDNIANRILSLFPNKLQKSYLSESLTNTYVFAGTKTTDSYAILLNVQNEGAVNKIEVFSPKDDLTPIFVEYLNNSENGQKSIFLGSDYARAGNTLKITGGGEVYYSLLLFETGIDNISVGRFEKNTDWNIGNECATLSLDKSSEGQRSLVSSSGWKLIESRNVSTEEISLIGDSIYIDVFVPSNTSNPWWIGNIAVWLNVPSSNRRIQLGNELTLEAFLDRWKTYSFVVPDEIKLLLKEEHSDIHFQIVLNSSDSLWIDNMRFVGNLQENTVNKFEPHCPGDEGCSSTNPLQLLVNNTIRIVPEGDLWFEVVGFPDDWTPASLHLGISAEDGAELTGFLSLDESVIPLSDWYFQRGFAFERNRRYLFKLHNLGGRPYRINAWVDGQVLDVASNTSKSTLPWVVNFY